MRFGLFTTAVGSMLFAVLGIVFAEPIMLFSGANEDSLVMAKAYFRIILVGMIPSNILCFLNAAKRGCQNSKVSLFSNFASNTFNVIFDMLLIYGLFGLPKLGVMGAGIATDIGYVAAMLVSIASFRDREGFLAFSDFRKNDDRGINERRMKGFWIMTLTLFGELLLTRVGFMFISAMTARIGTLELAVDKVAMNFLDIVYSFGSGLQAAALTMVGKSLGERIGTHLRPIRKPLCKLE